MSIAYVDGCYVPLQHAMVSMQDRGYQFADGVYEVISRYDNRLLDGQRHLDRLQRSLHELGIAMPCSRAALEQIVQEVIRRNAPRNGLIYMQVTRGVAARKHIYSGNIKPVLSIAQLPVRYPTSDMLANGVKVITVPDQRWDRCDVKSIALLPNVLAKMQAHDVGAYEAWQMNEVGEITEGSLSNAYLVVDDTIVTHPKGRHILGGITRERIFSIAKEQGIAISEQAFGKAALKKAKEAFVSSASSFVMPVVQVDDVKVGAGKVGPIVQQLIQGYYDYIQTQPKAR